MGTGWAYSAATLLGGIRFAANLLIQLKFPWLPGARSDGLLPIVRRINLVLERFDPSDPTTPA